MLQGVAYRRMRSAISDVLTRFDISTTQWVILGLLYESATGLRITDIARDLDVETPLVTKIARSLRAAGLIKAVTTPTDKRTRPVALTTRGVQMLSKVEATLQARMNDLEKGVSSHDLLIYFRTLEAFMSNATVKRSKAS